MNDDFAEIQFTPIENLRSKTLDLRIVSIDGCELEMRLGIEYARKFAEDLIKNCDRLEGV